MNGRAPPNNLTACHLRRCFARRSLVQDEEPLAETARNDDGQHSHATDDVRHRQPGGGVTVQPRAGERVTVRVVNQGVDQEILCDLLTNGPPHFPFRSNSQV